MIFQLKYGAATVAATHIHYPLVKRAAVDFAASGDWTPQAGDVRVSKDGGVTWANIGTLPTAVNPTANGPAQLWRFVFTGTELQGKRVLVMISDATSGKAVEDSFFIIETFGDANAMYPRDIGTDNTTAELNSIADAFLDRDMGAGADTNARTPRNALRRLRNREYIDVDGKLKITKENDTTLAWQADLVTNAAGEPIISVDPTT
jgi:hypothetical protein